MAEYRVGLIIEQKGGEVVARQAEVLAGKVQGIGESAKKASGHSDLLAKALISFGTIHTAQKLASEFWEMIEASGAAEREIGNFKAALGDTRKEMGRLLVEGWDLRTLFNQSTVFLRYLVYLTNLYSEALTTWTGRFADAGIKAIPGLGRLYAIRDTYKDIVGYLSQWQGNTAMDATEAMMSIAESNRLAGAGFEFGLPSPAAASDDALLKNQREQARRLREEQARERERAEAEAKAFFDSLSIASAGGKYEQELEQERQRHQAQLDAAREYADILALDTDERNIRAEEVERVHQENLAAIRQEEEERKSASLQRMFDQEINYHGLLHTQRQLYAASQIALEAKKFSAWAGVAQAGAKLLGLGIRQQAMIMVPFEVAETTKEFARFLGTGDPMALASSLQHALAVKQYIEAAAGGGKGAGGGGGGGGAGMSSFGSGNGANLALEKTPPPTESTLILKGVKRGSDEIVKLTQDQLYEIQDFMNERKGEGSMVLDFQ